MTYLLDRTCKAGECIEPQRTEGLCTPHYQEHLQNVALNVRRIIPRDGPCLAGDCDEPRRSRGLCSKHYDRALRRRGTCPVCGSDIKTTSILCAACFRAATAAHLPAEKTCSQCTRTLPVGAFALRKAREGAAKWRSRCKECEATDSRLRAQGAHRDRSKERLTKPYLGLRAYAKKLGIPWAEVVARYPADNRCEICGRTPEEANPGGKYVRLALDHCHETGALRGFICMPCNTGLGVLGDQAERLRAALEYLLRQQPTKMPKLAAAG